MMTYEEMINKYATKIMRLRNMDNNAAEMKAGLIVMQIMDEAMKDTKEKIGKLYHELMNLQF